MNRINYGLLYVLTFAGGILLLNNAVFAQANPVSSTGSSVDVAIQKAFDEVNALKKSVPTMTDNLFALDKLQKEENDGKLQLTYREVRAEMVKIIQDLDRSSKEISIKLQEFSAYLTMISSTLNQLEQTQQHLQVGKKYLDQLLFLVYKMEREIYNDDGDAIDLLKVFIKSDNIPATLVGQDILESLLAQVRDLISQANIKETEKKRHLSKLMELKQKAQESIDFYAIEIKKLQEKKGYLIDFMELYKTKQAEGIFAITDAYKNINEEIFSLVEGIVKKNYKNKRSIESALKNLLDQKDLDQNSSGAVVARPIYPITKIITVFNDPDYERSHGFKNNFLQVYAPQGTPVYAMREGVVYYVFEGKNAISWMMVLHTNGYLSVYSYLSHITVKEGDLLRRGQFIGSTGGEPGTHGAGFVSEGQNLTFHVFKDGVAVDPLTLLDLSVVFDKDTVLPEEYRLKYFNDQYVRPIDLSTLQILRGDSIDERATAFLDLYAVGPYSSLSFWDSVVGGTNIDRDMVICVAFAESTLGQYLTTENNIGNVGNNDRGDRIAYNNPYYGARMIPLTLNNQYLGNYHTINQLSRYGNVAGSIYASSPINWQRNVLRCLSQIKGYYVPEDFPFRTGPNPDLEENE